MTPYERVNEMNRSSIRFFENNKSITMDKNESDIISFNISESKVTDSKASMNITGITDIKK